MAEDAVLGESTGRGDCPACIKLAACTACIVLIEAAASTERRNMCTNSKQQRQPENCARCTMYVTVQKISVSP